MAALNRMGITVLLLVFLTPILVGQETTRQKVEYKPGYKDPALKEIEDKNKGAEKTERDRTLEIRSAREFRFYNKTTDDDHDIHLVGYTKLGDHDWFLIKDSASSAQHGKFKGYWFYREDYIKLKMLTFIVHKDAVKGVLSNFD